MKIVGSMQLFNYQERKHNIVWENGLKKFLLPKCVVPEKKKKSGTMKLFFNKSQCVLKQYCN